MPGGSEPGGEQAAAGTPRLRPRPRAPPNSRRSPPARLPWGVMLRLPRQHYRLVGVAACVSPAPRALFGPGEERGGIVACLFRRPSPKMTATTAGPHGPQWLRGAQARVSGPVRRRIADKLLPASEVIQCAWLPIPTGSPSLVGQKLQVLANRLHVGRVGAAVIGEEKAREGVAQPLAVAAELLTPPAMEHEPEMLQLEQPGEVGNLPFG